MSFRLNVPALRMSQFWRLLLTTAKLLVWSSPTTVLLFARKWEIPRLWRSLSWTIRQVAYAWLILWHVPADFLVGWNFSAMYNPVACKMSSFSYDVIVGFALQFQTTTTQSGSLPDFTAVYHGIMKSYCTIVHFYGWPKAYIPFITGSLIYHVCFLSDDTLYIQVQHLSWVNQWPVN